MTTRRKWIVTDERGTPRCWWCMGDPLYISYHDSEWGRPSGDDRHLFEMLSLDGFQAGLSWLTILRKRENFREAFEEFDIERVARMTKRHVNRLLKNEGIIRHRGKIESVINNAKRAIEVQDEFGSLASYLWRFAPDSRRARKHRSGKTIPAKTDESIALSNDLRIRGWTFVGPTIIYAVMQTIGLVNDHLTGCAHFETVEAARRGFNGSRQSLNRHSGLR